MKAQLVRGVEVWRGSDNVFTDVDLAGAENSRPKRDLSSRLLLTACDIPFSFN